MHDDECASSGGKEGVRDVVDIIGLGCVLHMGIFRGMLESWRCHFWR